jgi:quinol monooxygenase YgiN
MSTPDTHENPLAHVDRKHGGALTLAIAYHFHVRPKHHDHFRHAYRAAYETLQHAAGLVAHRFSEPLGRNGTFTLLLAWDNQASFERFIRTWLGVWLINGMGLERDAFAAPIQTDIGAEEPALCVGSRTRH